MGPLVWTIAGSDPSGGAGIQADLKTFQGLGVRGCSVVTAITAQSFHGVEKIHPLPGDVVQAQCRALFKDGLPKVVKIGMLPTEEIVMSLLPVIREMKAQGVKFVLDPIVGASRGGQSLMSKDAMSAVISNMTSLMDVVTPNVEEAIYFQELAPVTVIKGGHQPGEWCRDKWQCNDQVWWITSSRQNKGEFHGTGCTFASAMTSALAQGYDFLDAAVVAKMYVNQAFRLGEPGQKGLGLLHHGDWPTQPEDFPFLTRNSSHDSYQFSSCKELGFYPIVNRASWVTQLVTWGVRSIQLRIKDLKGQALEKEIKDAVEQCKEKNVRLFINDYWELAIKHQAYGVHVGQEDVETADMKEIERSGLRLGMSTHSYSEMARAASFSPSYVAIGPLYETTCKSMRFGPQGVERLRLWQGYFRCPVVAIGGISLDGARAVLETGVGGIAVISDVVNHPRPEERVREWMDIHNDFISTHSSSIISTRLGLLAIIS